MLAMGTDFDEFSERARTRFYEERWKAGDQTISEEHLCAKNRRILYNAMIKAGFTNYPDEWWHFDYGNQFWGKITGCNAIYGPTEPSR